MKGQGYIFAGINDTNTIFGDPNDPIARAVINGEEIFAGRTTQKNDQQSVASSSDSSQQQDQGGQSAPAGGANAVTAPLNQDANKRYSFRIAKSSVDKLRQSGMSDQEIQQAIGYTQDITAQEAAQRLSDIRRKRYEEMRVYEKQIADTPEAIKAPQQSRVTPLSDDPSLNKSTAVLRAGSVSPNERKYYYDVHKMLDGTKPFNAQEYRRSREVLDRNAQNGDKVAQYYNNLFDTAFARMANDFIQQARVDAAQVASSGDQEKTALAVRGALEKTFSDPQLREMFIGTDYGQAVMKQIYESVGTKGDWRDVEAARKMAEEHANNQAIIRKNQAEASKVSLGTYTPPAVATAPVDMTNKAQREPFVAALNEQSEGSGTKYAAMGDFKQTAPESPGKSTFAGSDLGAVLDAVRTNPVGSKAELEKLITTTYEASNDQPYNKADLVNAVLNYTKADGTSFDSIQQGIVTQAQVAQNQQIAGRVQSFVTFNTDGTVKDLSPALADKPVGDYASALNDAIAATSNYANKEGLSDAEHYALAKTYATRNLLSSGAEDTFFPTTPDALKGADQRVQSLYSLVDNKFSEVEMARTQYRDVRRLQGAAAFSQKFNAEPNQPWVSISYFKGGDNKKESTPIYIPEAYEGVVSDIIASQSDEGAKKILNASIDPDGVLNVQKFKALVSDRAVEGTNSFRVLDNSFDLSSYKGQDKDMMERSYASLGPTNYEDVRTPRDYFANENIMTRDQANGISDAMTWLEPGATGGESASIKGKNIKLGETGKELSPRDRVKMFVAEVTGLKPDQYNDMWNQVTAPQNRHIWMALTNPDSSVERMRGVVLALNAVRFSKGNEVGAAVDSVQGVERATMLALDPSGATLSSLPYKYEPTDTYQQRLEKKIGNEDHIHHQLLTMIVNSVKTDGDASDYDKLKRLSIIQDVLGKKLDDQIKLLEKLSGSRDYNIIKPDRAAQKRMESLVEFRDEFKDTLTKAREELNKVYTSPVSSLYTQ